MPFESDERSLSTKKQFLDAAARNLSVALQPIYALSSGKVFAFEALTRGWDRLDYESPHALFDDAERLGALEELELSQIQRAVALMSTRYAPPRPRLFVNLDIRILDGGDAFFSHIAATLDANGMAHSDLCIELSERHERNDPEALQARIARLNRMGFRFALDDFGRGVSDLLSLYYFDIEVLKIDRFLIDGLADSARKQFFVSRLVELAHLLGLSVVVEGVETPRDMASCIELNCDLAQGYHLGRPTATPSAATRRDDMQALKRVRVDTIRPIVEPIEAFRDDTPARALVDRIKSGGGDACLPIVDDHDRPIGKVDAGALSAFLAAPFSVDLLKNTEFRLPVSHFSCPCPVLDVGVDPDALFDMLAGSDAQSVIVTSEMKYLGVISAARLLAFFQERQVQDAREANPLSGLPGNRAITRFLGTLLAATECERAVAYFDFDHFKPFNDAYGFDRGDQAIELFAEILKDRFDGAAFFLGHVGGDDFVVGAIGAASASLELHADAAVDAFAAQVRALYDAQDLERGFLIEHDRAGFERRFSLMTCSAAVAQIAKGSAPDSIAELTAAMSRLKQEAKASTREKCAVRHFA